MATTEGLCLWKVTLYGYVVKSMVQVAEGKKKVTLIAVCDLV